MLLLMASFFTTGIANIGEIFALPTLIFSLLFSYHSTTIEHLLQRKAAFFHSIPNSFPVFVVFFHPPGKKNLPKSHFFFIAMKKRDFSSLWGKFLLKLNFKNLIVVLEAAEAVEVTI